MAKHEPQHHADKGADKLNDDNVGGIKTRNTTSARRERSSIVWRQTKRQDRVMNKLVR